MIAARSPGLKALSCRTSGQAGKKGSLPQAKTSSPGREERPRLPHGVPVIPPDEVVGVVRHPRVVGGHVVGDEIEHQAQAPLGEFLAGNCQTFRPAQVGIDHVIADAVGGADVVRRGEVGERPAEVVEEPLVSHGDVDPGRAPLPDPHEPDGI